MSLVDLFHPINLVLLDQFVITEHAVHPSAKEKLVAVTSGAWRMACRAYLGAAATTISQAEDQPVPVPLTPIPSKEPGTYINKKAGMRSTCTRLTSIITPR
jgi:hypothetical protein